MTYEYACAACGHQWEAEQSIKDQPLKTCVACGAEKAKRLVSGGTGFLLKGGGWYADGYGSKKPAGSASTDSTPAAKSADSGSTDSGKGKSESGSSSSEGTSSSESKAASTSDSNTAGKGTSSTAAPAAAS